MSRRRTVKDGPGTVYVLTNPAFQEDVVKVGRTGRSVGASLRARNLQTTGVPLPFRVAAEFACSRMCAVERVAHDFLVRYRLADNREFFKVTVQRAKQRVQQARAYTNWSALQKLIVKNIYPQCQTAAG